MSEFRIVFAGDSALAVEFEERIDPVINARAVACAAAIEAAHVQGVRDVVPTYRAVTVYFDPLVTDVTALAGVLRVSAGAATDTPSEPSRLVELPVCYDDAFAPDMDAVCLVSGVTRDEVVALHSAPTYRVFMLGFVPGFAYLGAVDPRIAAPRRPQPRASVPAGAVGIAGSQTGVYPRQTPGGWNLIGRTPLAMAPLDGAQPTRLAAGDAVRFRPIDRAEFDRLTEHTP